MPFPVVLIKGGLVPVLVPVLQGPAPPVVTGNMGNLGTLNVPDLATVVSPKLETS